ncbi:MAG: hypothetical protein U9Q81_20480 [Pseudomonadota bacterium]|nr:hypothetical protein [Pseudomonadota bacterium]
MKKKKPAIQDLILLRYREDGHVRFELPEELCGEDAAGDLERRLGKLNGIRRVVVYRRNRKLSIRYLETVCSFLDVARHLYDCAPRVLRAARRAGGRKPPERPPSDLKQKVLGLSAVKSAREKLQEVKETVQALAILARTKLGKDSATPMTTEKTVLNFLNDLVAFYLIKLHWQRITGEWLRRPFFYRYQWLAAVYLVFLMVRYRKLAGK